MLCLGLGLVIVVTGFGGVRYVWLGLSANWRLIVSFACCGLGICDFWFFVVVRIGVI